MSNSLMGNSNKIQFCQSSNLSQKCNKETNGVKIKKSRINQLQIDSDKSKCDEKHILYTCYVTNPGCYSNKIRLLFYKSKIGELLSKILVLLPKYVG